MKSKLRPLGLLVFGLFLLAFPISLIINVRYGVDDVFVVILFVVSIPLFVSIATLYHLRFYSLLKELDDGVIILRRLLRPWVKEKVDLVNSTFCSYYDRPDYQGLGRKILVLKTSNGLVHKFSSFTVSNWRGLEFELFNKCKLSTENSLDIVEGKSIEEVLYENNKVNLEKAKMDRLLLLILFFGPSAFFLGGEYLYIEDLIKINLDFAPITIIAFCKLLQSQLWIMKQKV